jgi:hypothetical protein
MVGGRPADWLCHVIDHAADRTPVYQDLTRDLDRIKQLDVSWNRSADLHADFRQALIDARLPDSIRTVAVSGSFGRMEVVDGSDCDFIVVLSDKALGDVDTQLSTHASECFELVLNATRGLGLSASKAGGIFSVPTSVERLCTPKSMGVIDEAMDAFGHRIQLLIDSQPVYGFDEFTRIQNSILKRYASETIEFDSTKQWTYLLNDLIRYHRSLCVRTQWATRAHPAKWRMLNLKLWHSRLMNYAGLLFLLGECSRKTSDKVAWLAARLPLTPLERVVQVMQCHSNPSVSLIIECYDQFLAAMSDPQFTSDLAVDGPSRFPDDHAAYQVLRDNSRRITSALTRFILNQPEGWSPQFHELLLF